MPCREELNARQRGPIIENCFFGAKIYYESDKQNAAYLPYSGCAGGLSVIARRPFFQAQAQHFRYQLFAVGQRWLRALDSVEDASPALRETAASDLSLFSTTQ